MLLYLACDVDAAKENASAKVLVSFDYDIIVVGFQQFAETPLAWQEIGKRRHVIFSLLVA